MKTEQFTWTAAAHWTQGFPGSLGHSAQLVLVFGGSGIFRDTNLLQDVRKAYPTGHIIGCSTAGEIAGTRVLDDSLVVTAAHFEHTKLIAAQIDLGESNDSLDAGRLLAQRLDHNGLKHVLVISDGLKVNGSQLVKGLATYLPQGVGISGGLSADGAKFERTLVCINENAAENKVAAIGFYGDRLHVSCASRGGWDTFGPERVVTRSRDNVLYELDGRSALDLYKSYLAEHAAQLPASGLLFPLSIRSPGSPATTGLVRTILAVNESEQSMTFAGDIPEKSYARLMRANFERLIDGAQDAAQATQTQKEMQNSDLAILISCVGRKLVLKQRVEEEVEAVSDVFGPRTTLTGFYSYGEISPFTPSAQCELHNQTMTITTFSER